MAKKQTKVMGKTKLTGRAALIINAVAVLALYGVLSVLLKTKIINPYQSGLLILIGINIILAVSLNLTTGFLGQLVLGHAGFMAVGAYTAALITRTSSEPGPVLFALALLVGGLVAAVFGIIIGIPALRLKGDYLAIITLGFGEILRVLILNMGFTGGARGLMGIAPLTNFNWIFWIAVISVAVIHTLIHSRHGRAIVSIREDEVAAEASGIHITRYKVLAFTIAAFFAGVAGGLYAHYIVVLDAGNFGFMRSVEIVVMVVLGGMGSLTGSVLSATVLTALPEMLRGFSSYRMVVYALMLILIMIFKPGGLLGQHEWSTERLLRYWHRKKGE